MSYEFVTILVQKNYNTLKLRYITLKLCYVTLPFLLVPYVALYIAIAINYRYFQVATVHLCVHIGT